MHKNYQQQCCEMKFKDIGGSKLFLHEWDTFRLYDVHIYLNAFLFNYIVDLSLSF